MDVLSVLQPVVPQPLHLLGSIVPCGQGQMSVQVPARACLLPDTTPLLVTQGWSSLGDSPWAPTGPWAQMGPALVSQMGH